jgi:alkylhydroperoxidase family enzyme
LKTIALIDLIHEWIGWHGACDIWRAGQLQQDHRMPFFKSLPDDAGPPNVFKQYPEIYGPWSTMSEAMMNGPSPLTQGERELILAYAAGVGQCEFVRVAHSEVAYAWGLPQGLVDQLLAAPNEAPIDARLKPLLAFVRKLMAMPNEVSQVDADSVFEAGWSEQALHDAIAITARAAFMQRLVAGHGFAPLDRETAASHAQRRIERGYVNLYRAFRSDR